MEAKCQSFGCTRAGYRIYFARQEDVNIVLLNGGDDYFDKHASQSRDIAKAKAILKNLEA